MAPKGEGDGHLTSEFKHDFAQAMNMLSDVEGREMTPITVLNMIHEETSSGIYDMSRPIAHQLMHELLLTADKGSNLANDVGRHIAKQPEFLTDMTSISRDGRDVPVDIIQGAVREFGGWLGSPGCGYSTATPS